MISLDNIFQFEKTVESQSRYLARLREKYQKKEEMRQHLKSLEVFLRRHHLKANSLGILAEKGGQGVIYLELPQGAREFHERAARFLLDFCLNPEHEKRWKEFLETGYKETVSELYENIVKAKPGLALLFEIAYRMLFSEIASQWWKEHQKEQIKREIIDRKFLKEISNLLISIRQGLSQRYGFDKKIMELTLDKHFLWQIELEEAKAQKFSLLLHHYDLTPSFFQRIYPVLYADLLAEEEKILLDSLRSASFVKVEEIFRVVSGALPYISEEVAKEAHRLAWKRGAEVNAVLRQELEELRKFDLRVKKQTCDLIAQINQELEKVVIEKLYVENLIGLTSKLNDSIIQFQRTLTAQLWYLQDLGRKEEALISAIEKLDSFAKMRPEEFRELIITKEPGKTISDLSEHLVKYYEWQEKTGGNLPEVIRKRGKELLMAFRENLAWLEHEIRELEREREKVGAFHETPLHSSLKEIEKRLETLSEEKEILEEGKRGDVEGWLTGYIRFIEEVAEPLLQTKRIEEMVRLWPPLVVGELPSLKKDEFFDEAFYVTVELKEKGNFYYLAAHGEVTREGSILTKDKTELFLAEAILKNLSKMTSVLVYDIRGSTFMGAKIHNALKERDIKNKFSYIMAQCARHYGGFLLKDTGDGGIIWFGENSNELYEKSYREAVTGKGLRLRHSVTSGADLTLHPSTEAAKKAVFCACEMVKLAEKFIQDNFPLYRDWFREAKEKEILHEGISYAVLPPEFKSLFRIGIGIASGEPGRDLTFGLNAYGDPDLTGILVGEASLYSTRHNPTQSVILIENYTLSGLLLNLERFDLKGPEEKEISVTGPFSTEDSLRKRVENLLTFRQKKIGYLTFSPAACIKRLGYHIMPKEEVPKLSRMIFEIPEMKLYSDEKGNLYNEKEEPIKFLYEVIPQE